MDKEILDELNRVADGFWQERKTLDRERIEDISSLKIDGFGRKFDDALKEFLIIRKWDIENHDSSFDNLLGVHPVKDYNNACDKFLEVVTTAKINRLIIDSQLIKELDDCKNNQTRLEKENKENKTIIEKQKQIIDNYRNKITIAIEMYSTLKPVFGIQESEVD